MSPAVVLHVPKIRSLIAKVNGQWESVTNSVTPPRCSGDPSLGKRNKRAHLFHTEHNSPILASFSAAEQS
jgi:hypothetical protein